MLNTAILCTQSKIHARMHGRTHTHIGTYTHIHKSISSEETNVRLLGSCTFTSVINNAISALSPHNANTGGK